jgi:hypothetical protein
LWPIVQYNPSIKLDYNTNFIEVDATAGKHCTENQGCGAGTGTGTGTGQNRIHLETLEPNQNRIRNTLPVLVPSTRK